MSIFTTQFKSISDVLRKGITMKRILIVDDEPTVRESITMFLEGREYEIIESDNGASAFDLAKERRPDLIITDVVMDNGNGFLLKELLREDEKTASIPVILMTGHAQEAGAWRSEPGEEYLEKPFSGKDLVTAVERALS